jgi:cation:H+ antiporter
MVLAMFLAGLALLTAGADFLVRGAARLAAAAGIAPIVIGLTVVAFGTSTPELAVTATAALRGDPDVAIGNVVGSNIANLLLILGLSAVVAPLVVRRRLIRLDMPFLIVVSILVVLLAVDGAIARWQGFVLLVGGLAYTAVLVHQARRAQRPFDPARSHWLHRRRRHTAVDAAFVLGGLLLMVLGSRWLVEAAETMAEMLGVSRLAIGLTVVAVGTSLPELATSVVASLRGERDIAVGNVVGSNVYNLLFVLGAGAALSPDGLSAPPAAVTFDLPVMLAVTMACLPIFITDRVIVRWEGALFLGYFTAYMAYVLLIAGGHPGLPFLRHALLFFALPLTVLTFLECIIRTRRHSS